MSLQVSNLFARDEMDEILNELIVPMKKAYARRPPTLENLYEFYMQRCRENLHVVLCFSPVGEKFRNRWSTAIMYRFNLYDRISGCQSVAFSVGLWTCFGGQRNWIFIMTIFKLLYMKIYLQKELLNSICRKNRTEIIVCVFRLPCRVWIGKYFWLKCFANSWK